MHEVCYCRSAGVCGVIVVQKIVCGRHTMFQMLVVCQTSLVHCHNGALRGIAVSTCCITTLLDTTGGNNLYRGLPTCPTVAIES